MRPRLPKLDTKSPDPPPKEEFASKIAHRLCFLGPPPVFPQRSLYSSSSRNRPDYSAKSTRRAIRRVSKPSEDSIGLLDLSGLDNISFKNTNLNFSMPRGSLSNETRTDGADFYLSDANFDEPDHLEARENRYKAKCYQKTRKLLWHVPNPAGRTRYDFQHLTQRRSRKRWAGSIVAFRRYRIT